MLSQSCSCTKHARGRPSAHSGLQKQVHRGRRSAQCYLRPPTVMPAPSHLFCPTSGALLDVDGDKGVVSCPSSGYSRRIADLSEVVIRKEVDMEDFFRRYDLEPLVKSENLDAGKRVLQKDDHVRCPKCDHQGVDFYTKQLRSADEGQTVFYECPNCRNKWNENS